MTGCREGGAFEASFRCCSAYQADKCMPRLMGRSYSEIARHIYDAGFTARLEKKLAPANGFSNQATLREGIGLGDLLDC
jgi:hypothetical protein